MKIALAYLPEEKEGAAAALAALLQLYPGARVRESDTHPPYLHIYLTTKKGGNPHKTGGNR